VRVDKSAELKGIVWDEKTKRGICWLRKASKLSTESQRGICQLPKNQKKKREMRWIASLRGKKKE